MSDNDNNYGDNKQEHQQQQPHQQAPQYNQQPSQPQQGQEGHQAWYQDQENIHKLEVGGGLLAGAALLAGGVFAYKKHEENKEEAQAGGWAQGNWINDAKARTEQYNRVGTNDAATWVLTHGKTIPRGAILVGKEKSWNLYICRAYYDGGIQLGKASDVFKKGGVLGYNNEEIHVEDYEVLIGDMSRLRWVPSSGRLNLSNLGYRPVQAGQENDGTPIFIAEAPHKDAVHPGKVSEKMDGAYIPYDGKEKHIREYRVLCYNNEY
jgi:hypothetical protein